METKTVAYTIKDKDLAEMLRIPLDKLEVIITFFEVDPDRKWELREHDRYIYLSRKTQLRKAFYDLLMSNNPMEYKDFDEIEGMRFYSLSGIEKLSRNFASELKVSDRREWCLAVGIFAPKILKQLASTKEKRHQQIEVEVPGLSRRLH